MIDAEGAGVMESAILLMAGRGSCRMVSCDQFLLLTRDRNRFFVFEISLNYMASMREDALIYPSFPRVCWVQGILPLERRRYLIIWKD